MCLSKEEFERILEEVKPSIRATCKTYNGYSEYFDDAYQQACLTAIKKGFSAFENVNKITMYLAATTHGVIASAGRLEHKRSIARANMAPTFASLETPEDNWIAEIDLNRALEVLPEEQRYLVAEILTGRITYVQAAKEAGVSPTAISRKCKKVRIRLSR